MSERSFEALLRDRLAGAGASFATAQLARRGRTSDNEVVIAGQRYVVELKSTTDDRVELLRGLMSTALLQARRVSDGTNARTLPIVCVSRLTERGVASVRSFMHDVAPGDAWGMLDRSGKLVVESVPSLVSDTLDRPRRTRGGAAQHGATLFTGLGQWMAKVMLAPSLRLEFITSPRRPVHRALHLATAARVSPPTVTRWLAVLRDTGFLAEPTRGLELARRGAFVERWRNHSAAERRREYPARFTLPTAGPREQLTAVLDAYARANVAVEAVGSYEGEVCWKPGSVRACLGLFSACAAHKILFVQAAPEHLYLESVTTQALREFGLELTTDDCAEVRVIEPRWPESVFRAAVSASSMSGVRVPTSDILQTWLDVHSHPVRGAEQAAEIERAILRPALLVGS